MRISLLLLLGSLGATAAHAQTTTSFGPRLGGNLATATFSPVDQSAAGSSSSYSRGTLASYQLGVAASVGSRRGHWAFQPALIFTQKGLRQTVADVYSPVPGVSYRTDGHVDSRINYFELPLNVVYGFAPGGEGFQLFAGPYVAVGVGGRASYAATVTSNDPGNAVSYSGSGSQAFAFGSTFVEPDPNSSSTFDARVRRFDAGINAGVGYRRGPVQVQLGYGLGLVNVQPDYSVSIPEQNNSGYHRVAQLTATYYFPTARR